MTEIEGKDPGNPFCINVLTICTLHQSVLLSIADLFYPNARYTIHSKGNFRGQGLWVLCVCAGGLAKLKDKYNYLYDSYMISRSVKLVLSNRAIIIHTYIHSYIGTVLT